MEIVTARQMQNLDKKTIMEVGIPGAVLMENAGRGTFEQIRRYFPDINRRIIVLCGRGNNGGDGFVIARYFHNTGCDVKAFLFSTEDKVAGDACTNLMAFKKIGGRICEIIDESQWECVKSDVAHAALFVDAMLGTGLSSEVRGLYMRVIEDINNMSGVPTVSVDIPSGIDATTGKILGIAVKAQLTCTFGLPKRGLMLHPGLSRTGQLEIIDIGIPKKLVREEGIKEHVLDKNYFEGVIPCRDPESHKGSYGHAFIIAGSSGKTGAAVMAARAAMRSGAGLVTLGVSQSLNPTVESMVTVEMTEPLPDSGKGFLGPDAWGKAHGLLSGKAVLAIGPGLSDRDETAQLVYRSIEESPIPVVADADALNAIAGNVDVLKRARAQIVLTPHPGEMARLTGKSTQDVQSSRVEIAREFSLEHNVIVVLKGAGTVIAEPGGQIFINTTGNPGMASGGMGDVLTGIISGLIAQGITPLLAAQFSVFLHGLIGDLIAEERAEIGILATDIIERIPDVMSGFIKKECNC